MLVDDWPIINLNVYILIVVHIKVIYQLYDRVSYYTKRLICKLYKVLNYHIISNWFKLVFSLKSLFTTIYYKIGEYQNSITCLARFIFSSTTLYNHVIKLMSSPVNTVLVSVTYSINVISF